MNCMYRTHMKHRGPNLDGAYKRLPGISVTVDAKKCDGCGLCVDACFVAAIAMRDGKAVIGPDCKGCGRCSEICPVGAITVTLDERGTASRTAGTAHQGSGRYTGSNEMTREERDALLFHLAFSVLCMPVLLVPGPGMGVKLFILVLVYNIALPVTAKLRGHAEWTGIWLFALVLSIFQVFPDWFLSAQLGVLVFPEDGFPKIGTVSGYMAGLWTIPIFIIIYAARGFGRAVSTRAAYAAAAAVLALVIFGLSEQTVWMLPSWYAIDVHMIGHTAIYIIVPEMILGMSCVYSYERVRGKGHAVMVPAAFLVMLLYLGSAAWFYFIVERVLIG